jgi:hypothetical protein
LGIDFAAMRSDAVLPFPGLTHGTVADFYMGD